MISPAAGIVVWLGASLIVVSDGRKGLAVGIALTTVGLATFAFLTAGPIAAIALALGGAVAATRRYVTGAEGWAILPPGSTPRLVLSLATALIAFWVAAGLTSGSYVSLRFGVIVAAVLSVARVLSTNEQTALLSAVALLSLSAAVATAMGSSITSLWPYLGGALVAAAVGWLPLRRVSAA
ncbi:MAG TPA: hypothetical protein VFR33_13635 [Candidatus Dormibacteraeota bacterium]|nr:hypothetical protein [Candidatus Dormibacteraeota bacterium]